MHIRRHPRDGRFQRSERQRAVARGSVWAPEGRRRWKQAQREAADSSAPTWKVTSSKRGKGSFEDLTEGSDDECRNGLSDDLDYQIRRTYGVAASVAPKLPNLPGSFRCIACSQEVIATNLGMYEACLGRRCLLPVDHPYFARAREVERSRSPNIFASMRCSRVAY